MSDATSAITLPATTPDTHTTTLPPAPPPSVPTAVAEFATRIGISVDLVTAALLSSAVNDLGPESLRILASAVDMPDTTWATTFPGVKAPVLRNAVTQFRAAVTPPVVAPATPVVSTAPVASAFRGLLPLADDTAFLSGLTMGSSLNRITPADAVVASRVGMASLQGVFEAPEALVDLIEGHSQGLEAPADDSVYGVLRGITTRKYADILEPLGVSGRAVTEARRKEFVARLRTTLWPALVRFHSTLRGWYETWTSQASNPGMMVGIMSALVSGGPMGMIPGMVSTPDVAILRSAYADLVSGTNRLYAGLYMVPVARAMAYDAMAIVAQLNDPALILAAGVTTREELLRRIGVGVTDAVQRQERSIAQYVQNAFNIANLSDADLPPFAAALFMLGNSIDWGMFSGSNPGTAPGRGSKDPTTPPRRETVRPAGGRFSPFPGDDTTQR